MFSYLQFAPGKVFRMGYNRFTQYIWEFSITRECMTHNHLERQTMGKILNLQRHSTIRLFWRAMHHKTDIKLTILLRFLSNSLSTCNTFINTSVYVVLHNCSKDQGLPPANKPLHGPLARYVKLRVAHALEMPWTLSPPPRVSDPDMHHGMCVTHVPPCMQGSLTRGLLHYGDVIMGAMASQITSLTIVYSIV